MFHALPLPGSALVLSAKNPRRVACSRSHESGQTGFLGKGKVCPVTGDFPPIEEIQEEESPRGVQTGDEIRTGQQGCRVGGTLLALWGKTVEPCGAENRAVGSGMAGSVTQGPH